MRDSPCFYLYAAHQLSHVLEYPAPFPGLRGHNTYMSDVIVFILS